LPRCNKEFFNDIGGKRAFAAPSAKVRFADEAPVRRKHTDVRF
jgi:hypothetical protein